MPKEIDSKPGLRKKRSAAENYLEEDQDSPNYKNSSQRSGWIKFILFLFELPTIIKAYNFEKKGLSLDDKTLPGLAWKYRSEVLEKKITHYYEQEKKKHPKRKNNLAMAVIKATMFEVFLCHFLEIAFVFFRIFTAFCAKKLLDSLTYDDIELWNGYMWAAILGVSQMFSIYTEHHMYQLKCALPLYVRGSLISMIYTKINKISIYTLNQISVGKIVNIVTNDLNVFERSGLFFTHLITGIVGLMGCIALLLIFFDVTILVGVGFMLSTLIIHKLLTNLSIKSREKLNHVTDQRIKITSEVLEGIRLLKMYTWELIFGDNIKEIREKELKLLRHIRKFEAVSRGLAYSTHAITTFLIYMLYTVTGGELKAPEVFATHNLFTFMRKFSAIFVGQSIIFLAEAKLLLQRIQTIIDAPDMDIVTFNEPLNSENAVEFENFSASWTKGESNRIVSTDSENERIKQENSGYTLQRINLTLKKGSLSAIVGKVGAGKTSFLLSFTGEMPETTGALRYSGRIAYVEQEPTIFAGTIRETILFGRPYNPEFYQRVVQGCNLESDFKLFPKGDLSETGEKGNNLSGGQRARLALARAVYADADIYLLDDPLSAVDAKVARSLYNNAIKGLLKDKTVILATHQVHFVKELENIMVIENGKIVAQGSYNTIKETYAAYETIFPSVMGHEEEHYDIQPPTQPISRKASARKESMVLVEKARELEDQVDPEEQEVKRIQQTPKPLGEATLIAPEDPRVGNVTLRTYGKYLRQMGGHFSSLLLFINILLTQLAAVAYGRILAGWSTGEFSQKTSLISAGAVTAFIVAIHLFHYFVYDKLVLTASRRYHDKMLHCVIRSPVAFFDTNPLGRILNRFSNDIGTLDTSFPASAIDAIDENAIILCLIITTIVLQPWTALPIAGSVVIIVLLILLCYPALKQTRNYEMVSRSPLASQFSSSLSGMIIIRSYKQSEIVSQKFTKYLNSNTRGSVCSITASRFFAIYVDVFYTLAAIGNTFIVVAKGGDPGLAAFAVMLIISVTGAIQFALRQLMQTNIFMASAARVQNYCELKPEAPTVLGSDDQIKKEDWPKEGEIEFNEVYMKYRPDLDYVIRDLTLDAKPGEKIGCVGRTGAGKSSIIQILFRMAEIDRNGEQSKSTYVKIDGKDTFNMGLHLLRNSISIIPQIPFCFTGTVKKNLDPLGTFPDEVLWKVLEDVNLKEHVQNLKNGLYTDMTDASSVFSVGQKQLVCLARTILKKSKMLVLDEATANVDMHTDNFIQRKIAERFEECTIFTIAHRLTTVANYDKILVLDKGRRVEFDHPYKLLVKNIGDDSITNVNGHFASMVLNTGPRTSQEIFRIAKETFMAS